MKVETPVTSHAKVYTDDRPEPVAGAFVGSQRRTIASCRSADSHWLKNEDAYPSDACVGRSAVTPVVPVSALIRAIRPSRDMPVAP